MATKKSVQNRTPAAESRVRFSASLIQQAGKQFYSVTMPTDVLASCCYVTSRQEDPGAGFQRVLDRSRALDIANYIDSELGTIPGSIILSAQEDANLKLIGGGKTVEFTLSEKAFLVLDGQHRVYGFSLAQTAVRVPVVIYSGLTPTEEARLFIDINTKQRQVPNELLLDIKKLAQREDDKLALLREAFDLFHSEPSSTLLGMMSPSARQSNKISRVTFNLAFKAPIAIFRDDPTPHKIFLTTNAYLSAFVGVLEELGLSEEITRPTVFRAIMELFPEVARISAAQHGKAFSKARFLTVLNPISQQLTAAKFDRATSSVRDLSSLLSKLIKKDFSI